MLCHIEIDTNGAHSFLTMPLSSDWKELMMKDRRCVRIIADRVVSSVIDKIRRKRDENSVELSAKISLAGQHCPLEWGSDSVPQVGRCSLVRTLAIKTIKIT